MELDQDLEAALAERRLQWDRWPPTDGERKIVDVLSSNEAAGLAWKLLTTEQPRYYRPVNHAEMLRITIVSFDCAERKMDGQSLEQVIKEFETVEAAFETLIRFYARRAGVDHSLIKIDSILINDDDFRSAWQLRNMQVTNYLIREFDIGDAVNIPIVEQTKAASNRALNFAYCLTFYLDKLLDRPCIQFAMEIAGIVYGGASFGQSSLEDNRNRRRAEVARVLKQYHADRAIKKFDP